MCLCTARFHVYDVRSHFCTLFVTKWPENDIGVLKTILERLILFKNPLFCFIKPKNIEKLLKIEKMLI